MGFLSRKKKNPEPVVTEETHPLEEELQRMEEAVPERPVTDYEPEYDDRAEYARSRRESDAERIVLAGCGRGHPRATRGRARR